MVGGDCDYPTDIASDGSKCGDRAASERVGGRNPTGDLIFWLILFCCVVYLLTKAYKTELSNFFKSGRFSEEEKSTFISSHPPVNSETKKYEWDGPWSQNFRNGRLMAEGNFTEGKPVGDWREYYESGALELEIKSDRDGYRKFVSYYYENGNLKQRGLSEGGYRTGVWEHYHENGQIYRKQNVDDNKKNGEEIWYFEDGTIQQQQYYENGKKVGKWKSYYASGQLESETHYQNYASVYDISYFEDGRVSYSKMIENNKEICEFYVIDKQNLYYLTDRYEREL